jgi:putative ABC transport system permease protein
MLLNYFSLAFRHLSKNKLFSAINLLGLAFGLAAAIAVLLYVQDEISYERFHRKAERIVRVETSYEYDNQQRILGTAPNVLASFLQEYLPEVETATRVFANNFTGEANVRADQRNYAESRMYWADSNVFQVFSFQMLQGAEAALARPGTAILSESTARRYFGAQEPLGQMIRVDNFIDLEVAGVFADFPANTHTPFEIVGSFQSINFGKPEQYSWGNASFYTYLLVRPDAPDLSVLNERIGQLVRQHAPPERRHFQYTLKPLLDVHLYSANMSAFDEQPYGDIRQVKVLIGLAVLLLLIACINYMNLATAQSQHRSKEVSLRKTLGAGKGHLAARFYAETALITLMGVGGSIVLLRLGLPFFNNLAGKNLQTDFLAAPWFWGGIAAIWLAVTLVAGAYPAVFLSSFSPMKALRQTNAAGGGWFRKSLVVLQFCISSALIVATLVVYRQLNFIQQKKLGYSTAQTLALKVAGAETREQLIALETEVKQLSYVIGAAFTQTFPGEEGSGRSITRPHETEGVGLTTCRARPDVFSVLEIPLLAGAPMRTPAPGDTITEVVLNRSAATYLGWTPEQAIGKMAEVDLPNPVVVGVVEDFHFGSLREKIGPYAYHNARTEGLDYLLVKLSSQQLGDAMQTLQAVFQRTLPNTAFDFVFLDEHLDALYRREQQTGKVAMVFAGLAIFIAGLGLFALAAFAAERRTKEIGIRKVLGASVGSITGLLARDFLKLVLISFAMAFPIAYYWMQQWLSDFAYRIEIEGWIFVLAACIAIAVAFLTVSYQSLKAALANPVNSLRSE